MAEPAGQGTLYTIGASGKTLRRFARLLTEAGVRVLVDVRLNNTSQLAGFSKKDDLAFICELLGVKYVHDPKLAPSAQLFEAFKKGVVSWDDFCGRFRRLITERRSVKEWLARASGKEGPVCLLCSEPTPEHCHRRLVADLLVEGNPGLAVEHLI